MSVVTIGNLKHDEKLQSNRQHVELCLQCFNAVIWAVNSKGIWPVNSEWTSVIMLWWRFDSSFSSQSEQLSSTRWKARVKSPAQHDNTCSLTVYGPNTLTVDSPYNSVKALKAKLNVLLPVCKFHRNVSFVRYSLGKDLQQQQSSHD